MNGVCAPECNSASCGIEDECLTQCEDSGCALSLLANGHCDPECAGELCAFDHGDCGFCAAGCYAYMLHNDLCEEVCFNPACGFDDCFSQEVYVCEGLQPGNGTLSAPYTALNLAFSGANTHTAIYLLGARITIWDSQSIEVPLYIQSLPCADRLTALCATGFTVIEVNRPATLTIVSSVTFARVRLTSEAAFGGIKYCPQVVFAEGVWTRVEGETASDDEVAAAKVCEGFLSTALFRVVGNLTLTVRLIQAVAVDSLTVQPLALIIIAGGHVLLTEVDIHNFHTQRSGGSTAAILSIEASANGSFRYLSGRVSFLNHGVTYSAGLCLGPFLLLRALGTVEIKAVAFRYNLVVEAYSNFLDQSLSALLYLQNFYTLAIADCEFSNNFVSGGLVVVDSSVRLLGTDRAALYAEAHILLSSVTFYWNLGEHCLLSILLAGDTLNVQLERGVFAHNAIQARALIAFVSMQALGETVQSRFAFQNVTITHNLASNQLILISRLANVQLSAISLADNGDFDPAALQRIYREFAIETNASSVPLFPAAPQCTSFVLIDACTGVRVRDVSIQRSYCSRGFCGLEFQDTTDLVEVAGLLSEFNNCTSQKAVAVHFELAANITLTQVTLRNNINYEGEVMIFGPLSHIHMSDSICEKNFAYYGTCFYLHFASEVHFTRVRFVDNQSVDSIGAGLGCWVGNELPLYLTITDSAFQGNYAAKGAAIAFDVMNTTSILLEVRNTVFTENTADLMGAVLYVTMPGVFLSGSGLYNCTFQDNHSAYGVIWTMHVSGPLLISNSIFRHNNGSAASVLSIETKPEALTLVENVVFEGNSGGPVILKANSLINSTILTRNCTFLSNRMGSIAMEGGYWRDAHSRYSLSVVSQILLSFGATAELSAAVITRSSTAKSGGAVHVMTGSQFRCADCTFANNSAGYAGAAVFAEQEGTVSLDRCVFASNSAATGGAALFLANSMAAESVLRSCVIEGNDGGHFGAVFAQTASFRLHNVTIRANTGESCPGVTQLISHSTITNSVFSSMSGTLAAFLSLYTNSYASISGTYFSHAFVASGGAIYVSSQSNVTVRSSVFSNIAITEGGVFTVLSSTVSLTGVSMNDLKSEASGSILYLSDSSLYISTSNFKSFRGTSIYGYQLTEVEIVESNFAEGEGELGGAAYFFQCLQLTIVSSSFTQLSGQVGGALHFAATESSEPGSVIIAKSHFTGNTAESGGAIYCANYRLSVVDSAFLYNSAVEGGALSLQCTVPGTCIYSVSSSEFSRNSASLRGGAISWSSTKPTATNTTFQDNAAIYGPDIASFPISLKAELQSANLPAVAPGQDAQFTVIVSLRDHYDQSISIDNSSTAEIGPGSLGCTVSGETRSTANHGLLAFGRYIVYALPNSSVELAIHTDAIPEGQTGDPDPHTSILHLSVKIRDCLPGEYRRSDSCDVCVAGTYSFDPATPCQTCPDNAQCLGNCTVTPNSGYWRSAQFSPAIRLCPNAAACLGGIVEGRPLSLKGWCGTGYKGNLCQSCDYDFSRIGKNKCERCPPRDDNIIRLSFIGLAVCILVIIIVWVTLRSVSQSTVTQSILLRIFVNYLQLVLLVLDFKFKWPREVEQLFQSQKSVGGMVDQVYSVDCFLSGSHNTAETFFRKTMLVALVPLPLVAVSVLLWLGVAARLKSWKVMKQECVATVIILYFLVLPGLVNSLFSVFSCSEIEAGEYWLTVDLDIRCWEFTHTFYLLVVGVPGLLVWVISVPLICLLVIRKHRKRLEEIEVRLRFDFLISGYRLRYYYWEFVIFYRKVIIISASVFISSSVSLQALTVQFVLLTALFLQYRVQPFSEALLNAVELRSIVVADVTIFCGLYYLTNDASGATAWLLFLVIMTANVVFTAHWLFGLLQLVVKSCGRRSAFVRRIVSPGRYLDEELEAYIVEFSASQEPSALRSLRHCYRLMLWLRIKHYPSVSYSRMSSSAEYFLNHSSLR